MIARLQRQIVYEEDISSHSPSNVTPLCSNSHSIPHQRGSTSEHNAFTRRCSDLCFFPSPHYCLFNFHFHSMPVWFFLHLVWGSLHLAQRCDGIMPRLSPSTCAVLIIISAFFCALFCCVCVTSVEGIVYFCIFEHLFILILLISSSSCFPTKEYLEGMCLIQSMMYIFALVSTLWRHVVVAEFIHYRFLSSFHLSLSLSPEPSLWFYGSHIYTAGPLLLLFLHHCFAQQCSWLDILHSQLSHRLCSRCHIVISFSGSVFSKVTLSWQYCHLLYLSNMECYIW